MTAIAHMAAMPSFWMVAARGKTTDRGLKTGGLSLETEDPQLVGFLDVS
jgi:hypothetical protein